jgi:hypothetical protein
MRRSALHKVPRRIFPLACVLIVLVFSVSVLTIEDYEVLHYLNTQYLSSESQDDDRGCGDRAPRSDTNVTIVSDTPRTQLLSDYLVQREVGSQATPAIVSSHLNRAPPL